MTGENSPLIAMVALHGAVLPDAEQLAAAFAESSEATLENVEAKESTITCDLNGAVAFVSLMPAPIPWPELEGPCATAWWWPEAGENLKDHTDHLIVALMGSEADPATRHVWLSQLVSVVAELTPAAGIYWGAGTVVHEPGDFAEQVAELTPKLLAPQLWIDMRMERCPDGALRYFTTGMQSFGLPEVEIEHTHREPEEVMQFCYGIINYMITGNIAIGDGETVGRTEQEKIPVTHGPSMFEREGDVIKLGF